MAHKKFHRWKKRERLTAHGVNDLQQAVERHDKLLVGSGQNSVSTSAFSGSRHRNPLRIKLVRMSEVLGVENSSDFLNREGQVQQYNPANGDFEDSHQKLANICDPSNLIYDEDQIVPAYFNDQAGKWIPLSGVSVRHAITWPKDDGTYPTRNDNPDTYPIKFIKLTYPEGAGAQGHTMSYLDPSSEADDFVHNINEANGTQPDSQYIPAYTIIWTYHVTYQWFTFVCCEFEESSSSASSISISESSASSSSSDSSSSLSSLSSLSSSSLSSSSLSSSDSSSSLSSGSSSSLSSQSLSSASSQSASSQSASSQSSLTESSGSSMSLSSSELESSRSVSDSSISVSDSSRTDCVTVVTSLSFDDETCELTYDTCRICFPASLGISIDCT